MLWLFEYVDDVGADTAVDESSHEQARVVRELDLGGEPVVAQLRVLDDRIYRVAG